MSLPKTGTPEWDAEVKFYLGATTEQIFVRARELGIVSYTSRMRERGIHRTSHDASPPIKESERPIIHLPLVSIREYVPQKIGKGDPETQGLIIGDDHGGLITPSFNVDVYRTRMHNLFEKTMNITNLHRNMYPVKNLVIFDVGDNIHGENPFQGAKIGSVSCGAAEQIYKIALPALNDLLCSFKQQFETVDIYAVPGNHGRYSKEAPKTSNWDSMLYQTLASYRLPSGINVHFSNEFCMMPTIQGFKFFMFHGDQVRTSYGIPYFALVRKVMSWYITYGGFSYAICGHWHKDDFLRISAKTKLFLNSSMVTDDPYALEIVGTSSIPSHWTFGIHKKYGVTWAYNLILDDKFLPSGD